MTAEQLSAPVTDSSLAWSNVLKALQRGICDMSYDFEYRRGLMKLHDYVVEHGHGDLAVEDFACVLVASGYCPTHLTEPSEGRCVGCDNNLPGIFDRGIR